MAPACRWTRSSPTRASASAPIEDLDEGERTRKKQTVKEQYAVSLRRHTRERRDKLCWWNVPTSIAAVPSILGAYPTLILEQQKEVNLLFEFRPRKWRNL